MEIQIDTETILQHIREGKALGGKDGALAPLIKQLTEAALQAEIESHLTQDLQKNRVLWHIGTKHDMVLKNCLKSL